MYAEGFNRQLEMGMSGEDVGALQRFLAQDPSIYPEGKVTNYFGSMTQNAVRSFQEKHGLPSVGRVGPQTLNLINTMMQGMATTTTSLNTNTTNTRGGGNIYGTTVNNTRNGFVVVNWQTHFPVRAMVYYSTGPLNMMEEENSVMISGTPINVDNYGMSQSVQIPVQQGMTYYYSIYTTDEEGNVNMTWPAMFKPW